MRLSDVLVVTGLILLGSDLAFQSIIAAGGATLQIGYAAPILIVRTTFTLHALRQPVK